jgi:ankyrin repeat protein
MIKLLIIQGAEVSPVDRLGRTPLYLSAQLGYREATKLLVNKEVLLSAVDSIGRTAPNLIEEEGLKRAIKALDNKPSIGYIFNDRLILL